MKDGVAKHQLGRKKGRGPNSKAYMHRNHT